MKLLQRLRAVTASHHENLHVHPALCRLTDDSVSRSYHLSALQRFHGFYQPLERRYGACNLFLLNDFPAGKIVAWLRNDLARGGVAIDGVSAAGEPPLTLEQATAYLYLREGSSLGGKVISKNLQAVLSLAPGVDNQFFWGHGKDTARNWQNFLKQLEALESAVEIEAVAAYAALLFQKLAVRLDQKDTVNA